MHGTEVTLGMTQHIGLLYVPHHRRRTYNSELQRVSGSSVVNGTPMAHLISK
jgi:hypothetical protein